MIRLTTTDEIRKFLETADRAADAERSDLAVYQSRCRCYHYGIQWIQQGNAPAGWRKITREAANLVGESGPIRATINRITKLCVQISSATRPDNLYVEAVPPDHAADPQNSLRDDALECAANAMIDASGLVRCARIANAERTVTGLHGVGLCCEYSGGSKRIRAFDFDASRLTLDPGNHSSDLRDHEYVVYSEAMTAHAIRARYGDHAVTPEEEQRLMTLGELLPVEMRFNSLSGGALYRRYAEHSTTKAANVRHIHLRDDDGRFSALIVVVEKNSKDGLFWANESDPTSPFGGSGLPYVLLKGWHRSMSRTPISDVGMMIDDQDKLNLVGSLYFQQIYNYTQYRTVVDKRWFGRRTSEQDINRALFSRVVTGDPERDAAPPAVQKLPEPSASLEITMARYESAVEQQGFRGDAQQGRLKSHVTTSAFARTLEEAGLPIDDRIDEDARAYEQIISVLAGTTVRAVIEQSRETILALTRNGLSDYQLGLIIASDPDNLQADLRITRQALRPQPRSIRRQNLLDFAAIAGLQGPSIRRILARDLDQPLSEADRHILAYSRETAANIILGQPFTPLPIGPEYADTLVDELRRAMTSRRAADTPGAVQRLADAIAAQQQQTAAELALMQGSADATSAGRPPSDELVLQNVFG